MRRKSLIQRILVCSCWFGMPLSSFAAPSASDALQLTPVQRGIPIESPSAEEVKECTIKAEKVAGSTAWVIRGPNGNILRKFADADGDNVVDTWSYYRGGLEIYRDIDADHNGKADQYRWFHGAGTRWGLDRNEDGVIESWKAISAEEVAEEVVEAVRTKDKARFKSLLLSPQEIASLGLPKSQAQRLTKRAQAATAVFDQLVSSGTLKKESGFSDFGGIRPGIVPAGTQGSTKDVMVYESVWAMVSSGEQHQQLQLGTLVYVNGGWKLVDGPVLGNMQEVVTGFFYNPGGGIGESSITTTASLPSGKMQEALSELEKLDQQLTAAAAKERPALNKQRADLLLRLANTMSKSSEREQWFRQLADMVSAASQDGSFPKGVAYLKSLEEKLADRVEAGELSKEVLVYLQFHRMLAEYYGVTLADPKVDYAKAQAQWMKDLEAFVDEHPKSEHGAEVLRQLAMGSEMAGGNKLAVKWYRRILKDYPESSAAKMAQGAVVRLTSEGKTIALKAAAVGGGEFDLQQQQGKAVVIQYWTTSSKVCIADHAVLKELYAKYGGRGLEVVGVNLDYSRDQLLAYLKSNRLPWKQLYEKGGFDSRLATEMGVVTVPLMVLVDPKGKVVNNNIQAAEIEAELRKLLPAPKKP